MGDLPEIRFRHICHLPHKNVEVLANGDGTGVIVIDKLTDDEIDLESLSSRDQSKILTQVHDWVMHYIVMKGEPHPANDQFGRNYVRGLNQDMGK